jgi:hypothetical protein
MGIATMIGPSSQRELSRVVDHIGLMEGCFLEAWQKQKDAPTEID